MHTLYWIREDRQGSYNMGSYETHEAAEAAIEGAKAELIDQCGEEYQKEEVLKGSWSIEVEQE